MIFKKRQILEILKEGGKYKLSAEKEYIKEVSQFGAWL